MIPILIMRMFRILPADADMSVLIIIFPAAVLVACHFRFLIGVSVLAAAAGVKGIAVLFTAGFYDFRLIIMPKRLCFLVLVCIPAPAADMS